MVKRYMVCGSFSENQLEEYEFGDFVMINDHFSEIAALEKQLAELQDKLRWRDVRDELPELKHECTTDHCNVSDTVLVSDLNDFHSIGFGHLKDNGEWNCYGGEHDFMIVTNVTHWRPLPDAPCSPTK